MSDTAEIGTAAALHHEQPPRMSGGQFERGVVPKAIVPVDFDGAWRIANITFKSGMAPKGFKTAEQCMVAVLHGLEVGLTPMNALQSIAVINGRPTIWGDGAIGLIEASGLIEDKDEHFEGEGGALKAVCTFKRKGRKTAIRQEFSMADAKKAGLLGKEGPWQTYPPRMLQMRARSWALRDGFSDVLKGLHIREEVEDIDRSQPNTEPPPIDDGGGPPIPPSAQIAKSAEPVEEKQVDADDEPVGGMYGVVDGTAAAVTVPPAASGFPGDDPLDIPAALRRVPAKPRLSDDERDWIDGLKGAFSACEDVEGVAYECDRLMSPMRGKVSQGAYAYAETIMDAEILRIQEAA